jgi:hypothetical protein
MAINCQLVATITVPDRWFASWGKEGPVMFTFSPSWSLKIFDFDSITLAPLPSIESSNPKELYERWEARASDGDFIRVHRVQKFRTLQADGRRVSCYERINPTPETRFSASCMIEGQMIASF